MAIIRTTYEIFSIKNLVNQSSKSVRSIDTSGEPSAPQEGPRSSVVIPWYRDLEELKRAVQSVFDQTDQDFEIIVVANGIAESDLPAVENLFDDARYRVEHLAQAGATPARNLGAKVSRGGLIFFLDADDRFHPEKLEHFHQVYQSQVFDLAFSRGTRIRAGGSSWPWPVGHWDGQKPIAEFFFCDGGQISSSALVMTRSAHLNGLQFDERKLPYQDPGFVIAAENKKMKVVMLPEQLYDWFDDKTSGRISKTFNWEDRETWISSQPDNVSSKAASAFRARCMAQHCFPSRPFSCLSIFITAFFQRSVPLRDLVLFFVRGLIPKFLREALLNRYFLSRSKGQLSSSTNQNPEVNQEHEGLQSS